MDFSRIKQTPTFQKRKSAMKWIYLMTALCCFALGTAWAQGTTVTMYLTSESGKGAPVGTISAEDTPYGLLLTPDLNGLHPGLHGFHVHENPACGPKKKDGKLVPGGAAGGHYDPYGTGRHEGPYGEGHLGDLPPVYVDSEGSASVPVLAPRLTTADIKGRSLMIHAGGDNYADHPEKLGGGGARIACGVVP
jgi:Cu-Zn family superoxide dismutase